MTTISDDFNRADGSPGASYETIVGAAGWEIASNKLVPSSLSGDGIMRVVARTETLSGLITAEVDTTVMGDGSSYNGRNGPCIITGSGDGYYASQTAADGNTYLRKIDGSVLGSSADDNTLAFNDPINLKITRDTTTGETKVYVNGVGPRITATNTDYAANRIGLIARTSSVAGVFPQFDNFAGGDGSSGQPTAKRMARIAFAGYQPGRGILGI